MELCQRNEAFVEHDGDLTFSHTKVILRDGDQYYYAITDRRYHPTTDVDPAELSIVSIPTSQIWPPFPHHYTRVPESLLQDCYIK